MTRASGACDHSCQNLHFNVAAVVGRWQRVGNLIGSGFVLHTFRSRIKHFTTCTIWLIYFNLFITKTRPNDKALTSITCAQCALRNMIGV